MPLKNSQYNAILRRYDQLQFDNNRRLEQRRQEVYSSVPKIREIDAQIARTAADCARSAVLKKGAAAEQLKAFKTAMKQLNDEKAALLQSNGYAADYLKPHYHCPDCKDTGFIGAKKCHCFMQAVVDLVYAQSNIRERLSEENFDTFKVSYYSDEKDARLGISPRENILKIVEQCHHFIDTFSENSENLLFCGNTGVGKTFLTNCIARELLNKGYTVIYLTAFGLVDILENNTFGKNDDDDTAENMFSYILDCDLLIIDDLGTELNNSFITSQLFLCINERLLCKKSTIISTNMSVEQLQTEYSERIFSRIVSDYTILPVLGEDIRVKKAIAP